MINRFNLTPKEEELYRELVPSDSDSLELAEMLIVNTEDRLRGAIVEALHWLDVDAPGRAYSVLLEALRIRSLNK